MNLVNQANFLTERIPEEKLTKMLSKHFSSEIQRGIVTLGLKTIDEIDEYLREVDEVRREAPVGQISNEGQGDGNVRQVMSHLTAFNDENDFLNSDSESEELDILEEAGVGENSVLSLHQYSNAEFKIAASNADTDEVSRIGWKRYCCSTVAYSLKIRDALNLTFIE
nr:unnamed protein product [Callosobruchus analis]